MINSELRRQRLNELARWRYQRRKSAKQCTVCRAFTRGVRCERCADRVKQQRIDNLKELTNA